MSKHRPDNERIKRAYLSFLKEAKRQNEASVDAAAKALSRFEIYTKARDFKTFRHHQAVGFKENLAEQKNEKTGKPLSKATLNSTLRALKAFFQWLSMQKGYKSKINYSDAEYFNLSEKEVRIATAKRERPAPTLDQVHKVLGAMPDETVVERRDRALVAFILLTGARDKAVASLRLKHIDMVAGSVYQDAREVDTKASKSITTYFFPVGGDALAIFAEWVAYLVAELGFGADDPLFPKTAIRIGEGKVFAAAGVERECWKDASPIRRVFEKGFKTAGLPYFNPHSFRKTLVRLGQQRCQSAEEFKAWSQNLGHEGVLTTFVSYGEVEPARQAEIIQSDRSTQRLELLASADTAELVRAVVRELVVERRVLLDPLPEPSG